MNIFELSAKITADTSDFDSKVGSMVSSGVKKFAALTAAGGAAVTAFTGKAVSTGMEFDKAMSQVQATMLKSNEEMEASVGRSSSAYGDFTGNLREFAQFLGENTVFSATQAAEALNFMALAGYDTQESMDMLPNVLSLAAAGNFDLARASDMVTDAQTAFGISADRTTQMVDEMAKTASISNTSVEQMGDAFLVVGGLAKELNGGMVTLADGTKAPVDGLQELEIALGAMANAGVKGSEAGTHMRNMLLKLASPTAEGTKQLEALGVQVFDAEGNMRSLNDIFGDLNGSMKNLTQEEKLQAISDLFNTRDTASAEALLAAVSQDWDEIGEGILNAKGAAAEMSKIQLDNLKGDVTLAKSAFEGLQLAISDEVTPSLREFVQKGTKWLGKLTTSVREGKLHEWFEKLRETFGRLKEAISPAINALKRFFTSESNGKAATSALSKIIDAVVVVVGKLSEGFAWVIDKLSVFIEWLMSGSTSAEIFKTVVFAVVTGITTLFGILKGVTIFTKVISAVQALSGVFTFLAANPIVLVIAAIAALVAGLVYLYNNNEEFRTKVQEIWGKIQEIFSIAAEVIKGIWQGVVDFFKNVWETIKTIFSVVKDVFTGDFQGAWEGIQSIVDLWSGYFSDVWEKIKGVWEVVDTWFSEKFGTAWDKVKEVVGLWVDYFQNIWDSIKLIFEVVADVFHGDFKGAWDKIREIVDLWKGYFSDVWESIKGIFAPVADWFRDKFNDAKEKIKEKWDKVSPYFEDIWESIKNTFTTVKTWFKTKFSGAWEAIKKVWDLATGYFRAIWNTIKTIFEVVKDVLSGDFQGAWDGIQEIVDLWEGYFSDVWEAIKEVFSTVAEWFGEKFQAAWDAIKKPFDTVGNFFGGIKESIANAFSGDSYSWGAGLGYNFINGLNNSGIYQNLSSLQSSIYNALSSMNSINGYGWGADVMYTYSTGMANNVNKVVDVARSVADGVKNLIGFSEPDEGPLSDFHTYAPDMMKLFAQGIRDNEDLVKDQVAKSFDFVDLIGGQYGIDSNISGVGATPLSPIEINIYATERQDEQEIAREVQRVFIQWENQRKAAYA